MATRCYPIGIQTFERIRKEDLFYVGETMEASLSAFDAPTKYMIDITPLLYQSGMAIAKMSLKIRRGDMDDALQLLQDFPYTVHRA